MSRTYRRQKESVVTSVSNMQLFGGDTATQFWKYHKDGGRSRGLSPDCVQKHRRKHRAQARQILRQARHLAELDMLVFPVYQRSGMEWWCD